MPLASMRSNNLGGSSPGPSKSLYIDGLDVLKQPGTATNRYGVPLESCTVTENGPGGVSSMSFTIEDPSSTIPQLTNGQWVRFFDHSRDCPLFTGFIQAWTTEVFGTGRAYQVEAIGIEAVLDWMIIPSLTLPALTTTLRHAIEACFNAAQAIGVPIRIASDIGEGGGGPLDVQGSMTFPLPRFVAENGASITLRDDVTITAQTLREGLNACCAASVGSGANPTVPAFLAVVTIDFWSNLRAFRPAPTPTPNAPTDYATLTIVDTPAGAVVAADLGYDTDALIPRSVYVVGGNAAGTGMVADGSGRSGPTAVLSDSTILTQATRDNAGQAYLRRQAVTVRGQFDRETFTDTSTPSAHIQAGSPVVITDAQVGLSADTFAIGSITKRFHGGNLETWSVDFGGVAPSVIRELRRLTRTVLN